MMMRLVLAFMALWGSTVFAQNQSNLPPIISLTEGKIWATVPFIKGGNFPEFERGISKSREQALNVLFSILRGHTIPMAVDPQDVAKLGEALASIIQEFERLAHGHISYSLQELLKASYDELFTQNRIPTEFEKGRFYHVSTRAGDLVKHVRFIAYGSYTTTKGKRVTATLTLEEVMTGKTKSFSAQGTLEQVATSLAQKLFDFFQSNQYPEWINPSPQLTWFTPVTKGPVLATVARRYCQSQGGRLPYAQELIQASLGGGYRNGGIALQDESYYAVADHQRSVDQYYYNTHSGADNRGGGPVHTGAGLNRVLSRVWCVKGESARSIQLVESIYRLIRETKDGASIGALEFLLVHLQDFGMRPWMSGKFNSVDEALVQLDQQGILVEIPEY